MAKLCFLFLFLLSVFSLSFSQQQTAECQFQRINPLQPQLRIQAEGGESEFWGVENKQFQCAGVTFFRHRIRARGLLLPSYTNAPLLLYVEQGGGIYGISISGCPETFESSQQLEEQYQEEGGQSFRDRHQKIQYFRQGDVIAIAAGSPHWIYNNGDQDLVLVVLHDTSNNVNQLDQYPRFFVLAGNPQSGQVQEEYGWKGQYPFTLLGFNVLKGFATRILAEAFGVDQETARRLQGENDQRGHIVTVQQGLRVISPPLQKEPYGLANGLEETMCTARTRQNLDDPSRADIYNPRAGRFTTANSLTFPILRFFQLSLGRGVLYKNAIMAPHWYVNCHSVIYATRGEAQMQIVDNRGKAVLDETIRAGNVVVVPHNFAVVKKAGDQGFAWVEFNTNDNAMINTLSGRTSSIRGMPLAVISNAYQVSEQVAEQLKYSRQETLLYSGSKSDGQPRVASK